MGEIVIEFDSPEWREERNKKLNEWLLGNQDAIRLVLDMGQLIETWDDLIDKDKPISDSDINDSFYAATVSLPLNPFYAQHAPLIASQMIVSINSWQDANALETSDNEKMRMLAFHIRNYTTEILNICVFLVGGMAHLRNTSMEIREFFTHESYANWEHKL